MVFADAPITPNLEAARWVSNGGIWEMGFHAVMFGYRFRMGQNGEGWTTFDLCCGSDRVLQANMLLWMRVLMYRYPEDVTERKLQDEFPVPPSCKPFTNELYRNTLELAFVSELARLGAELKAQESPDSPLTPNL